MHLWSSTVTLLVGLILLSWLYWRWKNRRLLKLASLLPGPPALPVIGNALIFITRPENFLNVINCMTKKYGQYVKFWLGPELNICIKNPADLRLILTSNKVDQKGKFYDYMLPFIGPGILTGGPKWRNHRKIAKPSYNKKSVLHYAKVFNSEGDKLAEELLKKNLKETFNVYTDVLDATTFSVCQTLMGLSKEDSRSVYRMSELIAITPDLYTLIFTKMTCWFYHIPLIYKLFGPKRKEDYYIRLVNEMTTDIVNKRKEALKSNKYDSQNLNEEMMGVVDRYLLCGELSEQDVKYETITLFTTSQEATAKIASGVLLFLAHLQDWQEKVYKEMIEVLGADFDFVSDNDLKKLKYLDMVYKEVLRYLPIAALTQRTVEEEIAINDGNLILPAGTSLLILFHDLQRDPQYWEEPNKVMPERFMPENIKKRDPNAFIPFSLGAMDCLGRVYAASIVKTLVVKVLQKVILEADGKLEDLEIHVAVSVRFAKGYNLRVKPRNTL